MNKKAAYIVFFALLLPSIVMGYASYATTLDNIIDDLNQALAKTIQENADENITEDTLSTFRGNLKMEELKETSYLAFCTSEPSKSAVSSDTMSFCAAGERRFVRAYPNCSRAAVFGMSEQTVPSLLFLGSMLWGLYAFAHLRRKQDATRIALGTLSFSTANDCFYNAKQERIGFTPMQFQFMRMLITSDGFRLPVEEICRQLWPGKEDARETLYTLVRRLKPVVENSTNIRIQSEKGHCYTLNVADS